MYQYVKPFGHHISGDTLGDTWLSLAQAILDYGEKTYDEGRQRLSLQNVVYQMSSFNFPDKLIDQYAKKKNIDALIFLTFEGEQMHDFDVKPSFSPGAKSYHKRITEGRMLEYVIKRLSAIPESKKAVMSFIHWDDYKAVLDTPYDDYLPCHTSIQFRILEQEDKFILNIISHFRSIDGYQKACGDFLVTAMLANKVKDELSKTLSQKIEFGSMMGVITDAHIYEECYDEAKKVIEHYQSTKSYD